MITPTSRPSLAAAALATLRTLFLAIALVLPAKAQNGPPYHIEHILSFGDTIPGSDSVTFGLLTTGSRFTNDSYGFLAYHSDGSRGIYRTDGVDVRLIANLSTRVPVASGGIETFIDP